MTEIPSPITRGRANQADPQNPVKYHTHNGIDSPELPSAAFVAGNNTEVQFNDGGSLAGDSEFTWTKATNTLSVGSSAWEGTIRGPNGANGSGLDIIGGNASADGGLGGDLELRTGQGGANGTGGRLDLETGSVSSGNGHGGDFTFYTGSGSGNGSGGDITIGTGRGGVTGSSGRFNLTTGAGAYIYFEPGSATSVEGGNFWIGLNVNGGLPGAFKISGGIGSDSDYYRWYPSTATTDGTPTTLYAINTALLSPNGDCTVLVQVKVTGRRTGGTAGASGDSAGYILDGLFNKISGTTAQIGSTTTVFSAESQAGWNCIFTVTGATIVVQVTGATNNNVVWHGEIYAHVIQQ